jgi:hypothetical protein
MERTRQAAREGHQVKPLHLEGTYVIRAPRETVYDLITDFESAPKQYRWHSPARFAPSQNWAESLISPAALHPDSRGAATRA